MYVFLSGERHLSTSRSILSAERTSHPHPQGETTRNQELLQTADRGHVQPTRITLALRPTSLGKCRPGYTNRSHYWDCTWVHLINIDERPSYFWITKILHTKTEKCFYLGDFARCLKSQFWLDRIFTNNDDDQVKHLLVLLSSLCPFPYTENAFRMD